MLVQGQVGLQSLAAGATPNVGLGRSGELLASELTPRYYQLAKAGLLFSFSSAAITVAATHNSPLTANTGTPVIAFYNPPTSARDVVILKTGLCTVSGQPGGPFVWNYGTYTATTATASTAVSSNFGGTASSVVKIYSNVVTTSSLAGVLACHAAAITNITGAGNNGPSPFYEDRGGDIIIPPGSYGAICSTVTGTSHVIQASVIWGELPS